MITILIEPLSGAIAAFAATLILHPLDTLKVSLQGNKLNIRQTISGLHLNRHWYAGLNANLLGNIVAWSSYFLIYSDFKTRTDSSFLSGTAAGACTLAFSNPFFVVKTRMISEPKHYDSFLNCFNSILKKEGLARLYAGFGMGILGTVHGGIQFFAYENIKSLFDLDNSKWSTLNYLLASGSSKVIATTITYPYQVIRTRLQQRNNRHSATQIIKLVYNEHNLFGFYRGLLPGVFRVLPASMITLTGYEATKRFLTALN
eukprot:NODE_97_length_21155_cov_0.234850.p7 type:complete len:259 gc:universal NODE_97_length_21155_cov_0.234850:14145-13369(-)